MTSRVLAFFLLLTVCFSFAPLIHAASGVGGNDGGNSGGGTGIGGNGGGNPPPTGGSGSGSNTQLINPLNLGVDCTQSHTCINKFIELLLGLVVQVGTVIVILMLVYVGFLFVKARGEPGAISEAREALLWTVIGGLILLGAQGIAVAIKSTVDAVTAAGS